MISNRRLSVDIDLSVMVQILYFLTAYSQTVDSFAIFGLTKWDTGQQLKYSGFFFLVFKQIFVTTFSIIRVILKVVAVFK